MSNRHIAASLREKQKTFRGCCSFSAQCLWDSPNPHNNHDYYLQKLKKSEINWFNLSFSARFPFLHVHTHTHTHIFFAPQQRFSDTRYFLKWVLMWEHIKRLARPWLAHPLRNYSKMYFHYLISTSSLFRIYPKQLWPATHIWKFVLFWHSQIHNRITYTLSC